MRKLLLLLLLLPSPLLAAKGDVLKKISTLPGFWEMLGGFFGVLTVGFGLYKFAMYWLGKLGYIKQPIQEELAIAHKEYMEFLQSHHDEQLRLIEQILEQVEEIQPFLDKLIPHGIPLHQTPFYTIMDKMDKFDADLGKEIIMVLKEQERCSRQTIRILRYIAGKAGKTNSVELFLDDE